AEETAVAGAPSVPLPAHFRSTKTGWRRAARPASAAATKAPAESGAGERPREIRTSCRDGVGRFLWRRIRFLPRANEIAAGLQDFVHVRESGLMLGELHQIAVLQEIAQQLPMGLHQGIAALQVAQEFLGRLSR